MRNIKNTVNKIVKKYDTRNPFDIADKMNIHVQYVDLGELSGFYTYEKRKRIILLNKYLDNTEYNKKLTVTMSHELGHAIMHRDNQCYFYADSAFFTNSKVENEANTFAAELLIDDKTLLEYQHYSKGQLSRLLGYKEKFIDFKIDNL